VTWFELLRGVFVILITIFIVFGGIGACTVAGAFLFGDIGGKCGLAVGMVLAATTLVYLREREGR
jgi:hypothetical protein